MVEELKAKLDEINKLIPENHKNLERTKERLNKSESQSQLYQDDIERLRRERQTVLAEEGDPKKINAAIREIRQNQEMIEDEILGLEEKRSFLEDQKIDLEREMYLLNREIIKEKTIRPLVAEYNKIGRRMGEILMSLEEANLRYAMLARGVSGLLGTYPDATPAVAPTSQRGPAFGWENSSLSAIPSLVVTGDETDLGWFYNRTTFLQDTHARGFLEKIGRAIDPSRLYETKQNALREVLAPEMRNKEIPRG